MSHSPLTDKDAIILQEAADWLVALHANDADLQALAEWRQRSNAHEVAWQRAEKILDSFRQLPPQATRATLGKLENPGRRRALRNISLLALLAPGTWLGWRYVPWQEWRAEFRTGTGEQKTVELADGTQLVLNTASAVDLAFTASERRIILLDGEILITTGADSGQHQRPFVVETTQGEVRPVGTRFSLYRKNATATRLAVFEGAVDVYPARAGQSVRLQAGEQTLFSRDSVEPPLPVADHAAFWEKGMLLARDMPLGLLVTEFSRYHSGLLQFDPAIGDLVVSGAFSLQDIPGSLALLEQSLPVEVRSLSPYWIRLYPR